MVPDGAASRSDVQIKTPVNRQSIQSQKTSDKNKDRVEDKQVTNRKVMVTMIDGGPVVATAYAVTKKDKNTNSSKKTRDSKKVTKKLTEKITTINSLTLGISVCQTMCRAH